MIPISKKLVASCLLINYEKLKPTLAYFAGVGLFLLLFKCKEYWLCVLHTRELIFG
jgi:hypothetical protein